MSEASADEPAPPELTPVAPELYGGVTRRVLPAVLATSVAALACLAPAPAAAEPAPPVGGPSCERIAGSWLGQTARWRILVVASKEPAAPLIACRRDLPGPALVRVLGTTKTLDDAGEDSESPDGGPYVSLQAFEDGRVVMTTDTYGGSFGSTTTGTTRLVDLDRGASVALGAVSSDSSASEFHFFTAVMTPAGALAYAHGDSVKRHTTLGPWTVWDENGSRPAPEGGAIRTVARSIGTAGTSGGIYYRGATGAAPQRLPLRGAADLSCVGPDPALAWQAVDLPAYTPPARASAYTDTFLDDPFRTIVPTNYFAGSWPTLEYSTSNEDPKARVQVLYDAGETVLGTLAKRSADELTVLTADYGQGIFAGRFARHPRQRRVLAGGYLHTGVTRFLDVPARRSMERRGHALVDGRTYALIDGPRVRLWIHGHGTVRRMAGAHDLAAPISGRGIYVTDGAGRAHYLEH